MILLPEVQNGFCPLLDHINIDFFWTFFTFAHVSFTFKANVVFLLLLGLVHIDVENERVNKIYKMNWFNAALAQSGGER